MYAFVDRPLAELDTGCRFLVWSMRAWVSAFASRRCPAQVLAAPFARQRMIGGLQPFHRFMLLLNRDALETFSFHPLACPRVCEHEALLLGLVRALQSAEPSLARATLALLVAEDGIDATMDQLTRLSASMAVAGLFPGAVLTDGTGQA